MTDEAQNLGTALPFCRHIWRPTAFGAWNAQSQLVATEWRCFKCGQPWTQTNTPPMSLSQKGITMRGWMGGRGQFDDGDEDVVCYCSCHDRGFSCCPLCPIAHETRETEMRCPHCGASYVEFHMCRDTQENDDLRKEDL